MIPNNNLNFDLKRLNLKVVRNIFPKDTRLRYTLLVSREQELFIMKWHHPDIIDIFNHSYEKIYAEKLKREIDFYRENANKRNIPKMVYYERHLILLEFIEGKSFREWLLKYREKISYESVGDTPLPEFKRIINNIITYFEENYKVSEGDVDDKQTSQYLEWCFFNLMISGPMDVKKHSIDFTLLRLIKRLIRKKIQLKVKELANNINKTCVILHGDLNLNNIIVKNESLFVIDWEDTIIGPLLMDLNYLYAMLQVLLKDLLNHQMFVSSRFIGFLSKTQPENKIAFFAIHDFYAVATSVNRRFWYNGSFIEFVKSLFKLATVFSNKPKHSGFLMSDK